MRDSVTPHQGAERHTAHHPGAHLRGVVLAGYGIPGGAGRHAGVFQRKAADGV